MANTKLKNKRIDLIKKAVKSRSFEKKRISDETVGIPGLIQPSEYDLRDELIRMDSFAYQGFHR